MADELKPCPFCGAEPVIYDIEPHKHAFCGMPDHPGSTVIECGCGCGLIDESREAVIERWNRRADSAKWRPIETAPKDGTKFLAYRRGEMASAWIVPRNDCEMWVFGCESGSAESWPRIKPSHWMPLPATPIEKGGA